MNAAGRELRRPRLYVVAAFVGVAAVLAGLPWYATTGITVVALLAGAGIAIWSGPRAASAARPERKRERPEVESTHPDSSEPIEAAFRREGDYWAISYRDGILHLHDAKGLRYIHRLLAVPGQELHVLDLVAEGRPAASKAYAAGEDLPSTGSPAEPILDAKARDAYRRRLEELRDEIEEAEARGDGERMARARTELEFITDEINKQVRPDGSSRKMVDETERARVNVTRAIRASIAKIAEQDASLGHHLDHDIRTGTYCSYVPDPAATPSWRL